MDVMVVGNNALSNIFNHTLKILKVSMCIKLEMEHALILNIKVKLKYQTLP